MTPGDWECQDGTYYEEAEGHGMFMKNKEWALSIFIHAFLGYLWVLFIDHVWGFANSMDNMILSGLILLLGTFLFGFIVNRITPFNSYKRTHLLRCRYYLFWIGRHRACVCM